MLAKMTCRFVIGAVLHGSARPRQHIPALGLLRQYPRIARRPPACVTKLHATHVTNTKYMTYNATTNPLDFSGLRHNFASQAGIHAHEHPFISPRAAHETSRLFRIFRPEYRVILRAKVLFFSTHQEKF